MYSPSVDIFCRVIDNFGDVGVTWRFARQLATERGCRVRFIIDGIGLLERFAPSLDLALPIQSVSVVEPFLSSSFVTSPVVNTPTSSLRAACEGHPVSVICWDEDHLKVHYREPGDIVIETFGCGLPSSVIECMKEHATKTGRGPTWIDLEYLSAEDWVEGFHVVPSFEPQSELDRTLFFPGFTLRTGGLLREDSLISERDRFLGSTTAQNAWRTTWGLPAIAETIDVSLFCYESAPVSRLLSAATSQLDRPVRLFVTAGVPSRIQAEILSYSAQHSENLTVYALPFLPQDDYDRLLWTCALNFVRGEDSLVRALWSGKPFIWQIYRQALDAHIKKLQAFLGAYVNSCGREPAHSLEKLHYLWNEGGSELFAPFSVLPEIAHEARLFTDSLATHADLASNVLAFARAR